MIRRAARAACAVLAVTATACSAPQPTAPPSRTASPSAPASPAASPSPSPVTVRPRGGVAIALAGSPPQTGVPWFLAIGDSVTFGFTRDPSLAGRNASWALQLQSLLAASGRPWRLFDTACPGETTTTYATGCSAAAEIPYLAGSTQRDVALAAIREHRADLRLILLQLGSNDLLAAQRSAASVGPVADALRAALLRIGTELESAAPGVPLVVANFYDPLENLEPSTVGLLEQVNAMVAGVAATLHARLADFFSAINTPQAPDAQLCTLVDCAHVDIHPTLAGHARLAAAALAAVDARG